jgi:hypothetical protein
LNDLEALLGRALETLDLLLQSTEVLVGQEVFDREKPVSIQRLEVRLNVSWHLEWPQAPRNPFFDRARRLQTEPVGQVTAHHQAPGAPQPIRDARRVTPDTVDALQKCLEHEFLIGQILGRLGRPDDAPAPANLCHAIKPPVKSLRRTY